MPLSPFTPGAIAVVLSFDETNHKHRLKRLQDTPQGRNKREQVPQGCKIKTGLDQKS